MTGQAWRIEMSDAPAEPTLLEQERADADRLRQDVLASPVVSAAFAAFPDAELTDFTLNDTRSG